MAKRATSRIRGTDAGSEETSPQLIERASSRSTPYVFISHDSRDADLAAAFHNLLTDASGGVIQAFRSSDQSGTAGIEYGENWYSKIAECLGQASDVVALLTPNSTERPWILFEAGFAVGLLRTKVFGISLGLPLAKAITGPFAQFQNCEANEESLTGVVLQLIRRNPAASPREQAVRLQVQAFLETIEPLINDRVSGARESAEELNATAVAKLFEEVKVMFRDLSDRVANQGRVRKRRRLHPMIIPDIFETALGQGNLAVGWMMLSALLKDDVPWLSEPAMEVYRAIQSGSAGKIQRAQNQFRDMVRSVRNTRMLFRDGEDEDIYMLVRHLPDMLEQFAYVSPGEGLTSGPAGETVSKVSPTKTEASK